MGKFANQAAYREWERLQDRKQDAQLDDEPPLSEAERAAEWDDQHWEKVDAYPRMWRQYGGMA